MEEKITRDRLDEIEDGANTETEIFISKDQQQALVLDTDDISMETRLTKGDAAPPAPISDELSHMIDSTRELNTKAYIDSSVKEVAAQ